jgi:putative endonuclease
MVFYTYILKCADGSLYTGWTNNLESRLEAHNNGKGAKYTKGRLPVKLVYWEIEACRNRAQSREMAIKKLCRQDKEKLVREFIP